MSVDLNWETLTSGPDGADLADRIRVFLHDRFQAVPLPRFIKSVTVHGFDFGTISPQLELKDITDPLPDFYEEESHDDESDEDDDEDEFSEQHNHHHHYGAGPQDRHRFGTAAEEKQRAKALRADSSRSEIFGYDKGSPFLGTSTPGLLNGPGFNYFSGHLGTGTHTPLAAVAGAHLVGNWLGTPFESEAQYRPSHSRNPSQSSVSVDNFNVAAVAAAAAALDSPTHLREKSSVSTLAPTSVGTSRPPTRDTHAATESAIVEDDDDHAGAGGNQQAAEGEERPRARREPRLEDVQAVFRIQYSGDIKLNLTAEILLDYPMPSFIGIPLKLNITGFSFDGVGVLANIRKRIHFCFLSPEDALTAVGPDDPPEAEGQRRDSVTSPGQAPSREHKPKFGGLLQEIKVESEIGERDGGKQSLKNVGKVERFVLEQVRKIFEEELVYPSFWTFLV